LGIAERLNHDWGKQLGGGGIDGRLCATASLAHDIGHPPFGHNGEKALDELMREHGGFEGNAQTLRIITRLEKKKRYPHPTDGDDRAGFNLCHRTIAAVLKYDRPISMERPQNAKVAKGYYASEAPIVARVKKSILNGYVLDPAVEFKTLECSIMDLADDIAYSVYDLEDCLKVGILTPVDILSSDNELLDAVSEKVSEKLERSVTNTMIIEVFLDIFVEYIDFAKPSGETDTDRYQLAESAAHAYRTSKEMCEDGYIRTKLSSALVHDFITGVELKLKSDCIALSHVELPPVLALRKEVLKQYTHAAAIASPRVKLGEYRGRILVSDIFEALNGDMGHLLMPPDVRKRYIAASSDVTCRRGSSATTLRE